MENKDPNMVRLILSLPLYFIGEGFFRTANLISGVQACWHAHEMDEEDEEI